MKVDAVRRAGLIRERLIITKDLILLVIDIRSVTLNCWPERPNRESLAKPKNMISV